MNKLFIASGLIFMATFLAYGQKARYELRTVLSDSVNSKQDESAAILSADGKTLYFVRSFYSGNVGGSTGKQDIYLSRSLGEGKWSVAENIGAPLNDEFHNAVCGVSRDGKKIYLNAIKVRQDKSIPGIAQSVYENDRWSMPVPASGYNFPEKGFFQVFVSYDGDVALVSFEGPESKGLEDLYVMKKDAKGLFNDPVRLSDAINTAGFETSPVLSSDGKTLYFSSNGHGGQGDADIFKCTRLDDSWLNWSKPENLGSRINTSGFDGSFSVDDQGSAYYISGEGASGAGDIYTISMIVPPPPPPPAPMVVETPPAVVEPVTAKAPEKPKRTDTLGQALFEFNSVVINQNSKGSLMAVVSRLKKNKKYRVQVEGHTDDVGTETYNQKLSERRALAVKRFLVKRGIPASGIKVQGFGELNPIEDNSTEEGRASNRRVEIKYFIK